MKTEFLAELIEEMDSDLNDEDGNTTSTVKFCNIVITDASEVQKRKYQEKTSEVLIQHAREH